MNRPPSRRIAVSCTALVLLSLGVCLFFLAAYPLPEVKNDAVEYLALARNVAAGQGFSQDGITPAAYRPPLFSLLLGGWFRVTGTSSVLSAAVFQSVLQALGTGAAFLLFLECAVPLSWAIAGALFLAVDPLLVTRTAFVLQEPTLILFTTLAVLASVRLVRSASPGRAALAGAAWGLCTLGKVVAWFAPFLLLAMRFLPARLRWERRRKEAVLLLLSFVIVIAPWTVRNYLHFHRFIPVNGQGTGLLEWNVKHARIPGEPPGRQVLEEIRRKHPGEEGRRAALWEYVRAHPRHFLVDRVVRNIVQYAAPARGWWLAMGHTQPGAHRLEFWLLAGVWYIPFYIVLLHRTWRWARGAVPPFAGFPVLFFWAYGAEHALLWGDPRFALAVYPLLILSALPWREVEQSKAEQDQQGRDGEFPDSRRPLHDREAR